MNPTRPAVVIRRPLTPTKPESAPPRDSRALPDVPPRALPSATPPAPTLDGFGRVGLLFWRAERNANGDAWNFRLETPDAARRLFHRSDAEESALLQTWLDGRDGGRAALETRLRALLDSDEPTCSEEFRLRDALGEERWFRDDAARDFSGDQVSIVTSEITRLRRATETLQLTARTLEQTLDGAESLLFVADAQGDSDPLWESLRPLQTGPALQRIPLGETPPERYAEAWDAAIHPDDSERVQARRKEVSTAPGFRRSLRHEYRLLDLAGALHWIQEDLFAEALPEGRRRRGALCTDVSARKRTDEALRHTLVASRCFVWHADIALRGGDYRWSHHMIAPDPALECFQVEQLAGESYAESWHRATEPLDIGALQATRDAALASDRSAFTANYRIRDRRGIARQLQEEVRLLRTGESAWSAVGVVTDQTVQQKALSELRASREEYRALFEHVPIGIYRLAPDGTFLMANPALLLMLGFDADADPQVLGQCVAELDRKPLFRRLERASSSHGWESAWQRKDGSPIVVRENAKAVVNPDGQLVCFEGTLEDITERRRAAERMEWQATHDALTGLPNRTFFLESLQDALANAADKDRQVGVLFVDLDKFKQINDLLGHGVGDKLLPVIADRLRSVVRESDVVARMGGDEFTLLLPDLKDPLAARRLAVAVRNAIAEPIEFDERKFDITVSVGAVLYPRDGTDAETLLRHADIAMYRAKSHGGDDISFFAASMHEEMRERVTLEADLRRAVSNGELVLHYQPQVSIASHRVVGVEALVRWNHPERGLLPPGQFIPLAEETGLIMPLSEWVLREACRQGAEWLASGVPLRLSVNMSPKQLMQSDYPGLVESVLRDSQFDPRLLEIELTESAILESGSWVESAMKALKNLGVGLQIDDFGTGYSSLALLRRYPMDVLKIDKGFVTGIATSTEDAAIVRSVLELAHTLGMMVIAEGVETRVQLEILEGLGCDIVQGYLTGGPVPAENLLHSIAQIGGVAVPSRRAA